MDTTAPFQLHNDQGNFVRAVLVRAVLGPLKALAAEPCLQASNLKSCFLPLQSLPGTFCFSTQPAANHADDDSQLLEASPLHQLVPDEAHLTVPRPLCLWPQQSEKTEAVVGWAY